MPNPNKKAKPTDELFDEVKNGTTDKAELFRKYGPVYARMYRAVDHCMQLVAESSTKPYQRKEVPANGIWFGKAGSGKTWAAEQAAIDQGFSMFKVPIAQVRKGWFDGYEGEQIILFDDFRGSSMEPHEFLNLLDGLQRLPIKGGYVKNLSKVLFFTSPDHPINWWPKWYAKDSNNWAQVKRRLDKVFSCDEQVATETAIGDAEFYKTQIETIYVK